MCCKYNQGKTLATCTDSQTVVSSKIYNSLLDLFFPPFSRLMQLLCNIHIKKPPVWSRYSTELKALRERSMSVANLWEMSFISCSTNAAPSPPLAPLLIWCLELTWTQKRWGHSAGDSIVVVSPMSPFWVSNSKHTRSTRLQMSSL